MREQEKDAMIDLDRLLDAAKAGEALPAGDDLKGREKEAYYLGMFKRLLESGRLSDDGVTAELNADLLKHSDSLVALDDLWFEVAQVLGITLKQASEFVEVHFNKHSLSLYLEEQRTGLWYPVGEWSVNNEGVYLMETWNVAETLGWDRARWSECRFPRLTRLDANWILRDARDIRGEKLTETDDGNETEGQATRERYEDDPRWPDELSIAVTAWNAARNNAERENKRPGAYIREWLAKNCPELTREARKRIATVANWDKSPGR